MLKASGKSYVPIDNSVKLSVLIPTFNSQQTIENCINSVLQQVTNFIVEIIVIDDGSNDSTTQIVRDMFLGNHFLKLIVLPENQGKGRAIRHAYQAAHGKYIQVLDSDDYLIGTNKFLKQVEFLENNPEYGAVAHNTIIQYPKDEYSFISKETSSRDFTYEQIMKFELYFHTSSVMFRKIPDGLPASFESLKSFRGDSAFTYFHFFVNKLKLQYLPDIMSIYDYHENGLWSKMSPEEQLLMTYDLFRDLQTHIIQDANSQEHLWLTEKISNLPTSAPKQPIRISISLEKLLSHLTELSAQVYNPEKFAKVNTDTFTISLIDSFCEAISKVVRLSKSHISNTEKSLDKPKTVIILVSGFKQNGGGIFKEIQNLVSIHLSLGYYVILVSTEVVDWEVEDVPAVFSAPNLLIYKANQDTLLEKVTFIQDIFSSHDSERMICLISHHDIIAASALYPEASRNIILHFVYDHISTLGLTNSSVNSILTKFESQARRISTLLPHTKVILIPPFVNTLHEVNPHSSKSFSKLNSASGSARAFKFENREPDLFIHVITSVLSHFNGVHFHYGPISPEYLAKIYSELELHAIERHRFVPLPFSNDFQGDLLARGIGLFIPPFPVPSINLTIEVLACGIPLLAQKDLFHMVEISEITGSNQFFWNTKEDLKSCLSRINEQSLYEASSHGYLHYESNHSLKAAVHNFKTLPEWTDHAISSVEVIRDLGSEGIIDMDAFINLITHG